MTMYSIPKFQSRYILYHLSNHFLYSEMSVSIMAPLALCSYWVVSSRHAQLFNL